MKKLYQDTVYSENLEVQGEIVSLNVKITKAKGDDIYIESVKDGETEINIDLNGISKNDLTTWIKFLTDIKARMK